MSKIIRSNTCPNCNGVIFSFDFDKEKDRYVCKTCGNTFAPMQAEDDRDLDPKDRIGGYMNQSGVDFSVNTLQGEQQVEVIEKPVAPLADGCDLPKEESFLGNFLRENAGFFVMAIFIMMAIAFGLMAIVMQMHF